MTYFEELKARYEEHHEEHKAERDEKRAERDERHAFDVAEREELHDRFGVDEIPADNKSE